ncbi:efflux RND transporter periplasmic adaptor subunit [Acanthopleuribacter pedis]|uniref:Efflux RND transporter periplasmic adaptor subunit n=1 Tax=Acanthopleuribacter pedis TaxID=442870 RepID=A0A8J7Q6P8_9BACT|nr:efflux RND transporter periplasmic adaptor subunit [Acanthopleuribacter pedis]MBO1317749.1 efflux RND transporter periplasmic adaptor subunit [Acanthopleuribacter pedis]
MNETNHDPNKGSHLEIRVKRSHVLSILGAGVVLALSVFVAGQIIATKPKPEQAKVAVPVIPVEIIHATRGPQQIAIEAGGTVIPAREVQISPQVGGRVTALHPALIPGGFLEAGEALLDIDPRDYQFLVEQQKAQVARAAFTLKDEEGRRAIAEQEWKLLGQSIETTEAGRELALRGPQLAQAQANLKAAESALEQAELNLARTRLKVPFNAQVRSETVEVGQQVGPNTPVAVLTGTDTYWVQASVPLDQLDAFQKPDRAGRGGALAMIEVRTANGVITRQGQVVRLLNQLEERGRLARVLISVPDPLNLQSGSQEPPLLLGTYVHVRIEGRRLGDVAVLPPTAMREGDRIWVMNDRDELAIRQATVAWRQGAEVLVSEGVQSGERVVVSRIGAPLPGLKLQAIEKAEADPSQQNPATVRAGAGGGPGGGGE